MKTDSLQLPSFTAGILQVWRRNFFQFRKSWFRNLFWIVLEPLLMLLAIGYGLGSFVSNIQGISYVDFFFPSLLCMSAMVVSFFETSYGNYSKLVSARTYSTMILTPLDARQIVLGEIFWGATKGTLSATGVALLAGMIGHLDNLMLLPSLAVIFLTSFLFAALGLFVVSSAKAYDNLTAPTTGLIVPLSLFSGTYFPLEQLPAFLKYISYLSPLSHSVTLVRNLLLGGLPWWEYIVHLFVLVMASAFLVHFAIQRISKKLQN